MCSSISRRKPPSGVFRADGAITPLSLLEEAEGIVLELENVADRRHPRWMIIRQWSLDPHSSISFIARVVTTSCSPWDAKTWSSCI